MESSSSTLLELDTFPFLSHNFTERINASSSECFGGRPGPAAEGDVELEFLEKKKVIQWVAYRIIGPGVVGVGLLGNFLNLIVLTRPSMKGVTYTYLIGLAMSDIAVLLCAVPMMIRQSSFERENSWAVSFFYSHLEYPLANTFMASSIFIVICLTIDRFASVCLPTRFKDFHTSKNSHGSIALSLALATIVSAPLSLLNRQCKLPDSWGYTSVENYTITEQFLWRFYLYTQESIVRFGPAIILATLNFLIIWRFRKITQKRREILRGGGGAGGEMPSNEEYLLRGEKISRKIYKEEKRLVTLLSAIVLLFFVTMTPVAILSISYSDTLDNNLYFQIFRAVANDLELCNFALNFYIYFLCSKEFRKKFLSFFTVLRQRTTAGGRKGSFQSVAMPTNNHHAISQVPPPSSRTHSPHNL